VPEVAEYQIKIVDKKQEDVQDSRGEAERHKLRREFWTMALPILGNTIPIFKNINTTKDNRLNGASGSSGVTFDTVIRMNGYQCEIYIDFDDRMKNKNIFNALKEKRQKYETSCSINLNWQELPDKKACRIYISDDSIGGLNERDSWVDGANWLAENMKKLYDTFKLPIEEAVKQYK
jgi:hypothetical protein